MDSSANAALHLEGRSLPNGWVVGPLRVPDDDATGGMFSVSYPVERADGTKGFLKVLNLAVALRSPSFVDALQSLTTQFAAERDLCIMCGERRLSNVVVAIDHGEIQLPEFALGSVSYIVFELATHDVRRALAIGATVDDVIKLEYLHSMALGLRQLHSARVSHQDLKPSNFLVFPDLPSGRATGKLGDLGRAFRADAPSALDLLPVPGDRNYAPPEQQYGHVYPDEKTRRYAADLYQLGSLAAFMFTGRTINAWLSEHLDSAHHWNAWGDEFEAVLPYLDDAFGDVLDGIEAVRPGRFGAELRQMISYLCEPDATRRGHPSARRQLHGNPYALDRVITAIDLSARRLSRSAAA
ncbi:protein kinase domain-containing protein [Microbacterium paraoxydans]|uniref:non-specific serine/threonine protein kinase n=1 Tax=Microbacterium paraoxydans TaxID=199592 RepID=A0ABS5IJR9_9MICO|nr:hypothetical protein [Microbacterium paraoxydans]MBS0023212.1 hypothetical protein [Microbacterium paraoxydans]